MGKPRGYHKLKIREEHLYLMKDCIFEYVKNHLDLWEMYIKGIERPRLMGWFFLRASKVGGDSNLWICDELYQYLNDRQIQSALDCCMELVKEEMLKFVLEKEYED